MNKNILSLFFFINLISFNFVIKSMQLPKKPDLVASSTRETKVTSSLFFENEQNSADHDFIDSTIEKISDSQYQIIFKTDLNAESQKLLVDQKSIDAIRQNSAQNKNKKIPTFNDNGEQTGVKIVNYSYLRVSIPNLKDTYLRVDQDTINKALLPHSNHSSASFKKNKRPKKVVVTRSSTSSESDESQTLNSHQSSERTELTPIQPKDFYVPHPEVNQDTTTASYSKEFSQAVAEKHRQEKEKRRVEKNQRMIEEEIEAKRKQNNLMLKRLTLTFRQEYNQKIEESTRAWHEESTLSKEEVAKLKETNTVREQLGLPAITPEEYFKHFFDNHMNKLASFHIEQHRFYNETLEKKGLPPISYPDFSREMGHDIKKKDRQQNGPSTRRLTDMENLGTKQLEFIEKLNKKTKTVEAKRDQYCTKEYLKSRAIQLPQDAIIDEGVIIFTQAIRSLFPRQDVAEAIESYNTGISNEKKEIELKKNALSLMKTEKELEKEMDDTLFTIVEQSQRILYPTKKKKSKEELLDNLKKQRDKQTCSQKTKS